MAARAEFDFAKLPEPLSAYDSAWSSREKDGRWTLLVGHHRGDIKDQDVGIVGSAQEAREAVRELNDLLQVHKLVVRKG